MSLPSPDEVVDAVRRAGWLLEHQTTDALEAAGFHPVMGYAYEDPQEPGASREVDVAGYHRFLTNEKMHLTVSARVIAECKQSAMPYVVVARPMPEWRRRRQPTEHVLRFRTIETGRVDIGGGSTQIKSEPAWTWLGLDKLPGSPSQDPLRGVHLVRLDRRKTWEAENSAIFTSLVYPLAKALKSFQNGMESSERGPGNPVSKNLPAQVVLHFPVVVTSAPVYVIDATQGTPTAVEVEWASATRQLASKSLKGDFTIDIVSSQHLPKYLDERVSRFAQGVADLASESPEKFITAEADRGN
jgi:hypothetical protein